MADDISPNSSVMEIKSISYTYSEIINITFKPTRSSLVGKGSNFYKKKVKKKKQTLLSKCFYLSLNENTLQNETRHNIGLD